MVFEAFFTPQETAAFLRAIGTVELGAVTLDKARAARSYGETVTMRTEQFGPVLIVLLYDEARDAFRISIDRSRDYPKINDPLFPKDHPSICEVGSKCPQAVTRDRRVAGRERFYITFGHSGFNNAANNGFGYGSEEDARGAITRLEAKARARRQR